MRRQWQMGVQYTTVRNDRKGTVLKRRCSESGKGSTVTSISPAAARGYILRMESSPDVASAICRKTKGGMRSRKERKSLIHSGQHRRATIVFERERGRASNETTFGQEKRLSAI